MCTFLNPSLCIYFFFFLQLQLSADVEVVFARGTVTPGQQKKVPLTQTQDEEHRVDGDSLMLSVSLHEDMLWRLQGHFCLKLICFQRTQLWGTGMRQGTAQLQSWRRTPWTSPLLQVRCFLPFPAKSALQMQTFCYLSETTGCNFSLSLLLSLCRGRSVSAHTQRESMWFFGCVCDPRVIFTAASG